MPSAPPVTLPDLPTRGDTHELVAAAIEAMEKYTGAERGYRRAHPRGLVCRASFSPAAALRELTTAEHLQGPVVPALVRLSNAAGSPHAPDHVAGSGQVLGLAVRFHLPSGGVASWAAASLPSFVARSPEDFVRLTKALKPALLGKPNPLKLLLYLLTRPSSFRALLAVITMRAHASFADVRFNGIHTYFLVAPSGARQPFRYHWAPQGGASALSRSDAKRLPPRYLLDELRSRLAVAPLRWDLVFQFPQPGDPLDDATRRWPDDRRTLLAGTLTVGQVERDQRALETLVFDPTGVISGIELSGDPLLRFRSQVYGESHHRRTHELRASAAPPDMGQ